jgi:hypothetical protein
MPGQCRLHDQYRAVAVLEHEFAIVRRGHGMQRHDDAAGHGNAIHSGEILGPAGHQDAHARALAATAGNERPGGRAGLRQQFTIGDGLTAKCEDLIAGIARSDVVQQRPERQRLVRAGLVCLGKEMIGDVWRKVCWHVQ